MAERDPQLAKRALVGLDAYERALRAPKSEPRQALAAQHGSVLRDHGGTGAPIVLVPSLINPPHILDLDPDVSLAAALTTHGRVLLLDWGDARARSQLNVADHVEKRLLPLLAQLSEPPVLIGYCLGGTMALAAAQLAPVAKVATLAAPWHFAGYSGEARRSLRSIWDGSSGASGSLGALPMEVLQAAFWALDPERTVAKFAHFGALDADSAEARRFVSLEDWANEGEPLPLPAARELFVGMFGEDLPGSGRWTVGGKAMAGNAPCPALHVTAASDHIVPAASAPDGERVTIPSGHVGMIVGGKRALLHEALGRFIAG